MPIYPLHIFTLLSLSVVWAVVSNLPLQKNNRESGRMDITGCLKAEIPHSYYAAHGDKIHFSGFLLSALKPFNELDETYPS